MDIDEIIKQSEINKSKGTDYFKAGKYQSAVEFYDQVVTLLVGEVELEGEQKTKCNELLLAAYLNIAMCELKLQEFLKAISNCDKALALDPQNEKGLFRRGQAYMNIAIVDFKAVLEVEPNNKAAKNQLLMANKNIKDTENELFERFAKLDAQAESDDAKGATSSIKSESTKVKCGWCPKIIQSHDIRTALSDHYRQELLKLNPEHLHFVKKLHEFKHHNISCRICGPKQYKSINHFLHHIKRMIENDKLAEDQMTHTKLLEAIVQPFVEKDLGELEDSDMRNRLLTLLLSAYYRDDEDLSEDTSSDRLLQISMVNTMPGGELQKKVEERKAKYETWLWTYAWRFGPGGVQENYDEETDGGWLGFTEEMVHDLACQAIKPYDEQADLALALAHHDTADDYYTNHCKSQ